MMQSLQIFFILLGGLLNCKYETLWQDKSLLLRLLIKPFASHLRWELLLRWAIWPFGLVSLIEFTNTYRSYNSPQTNNAGTNTTNHVLGSNGSGPVMKQMISYQTPDGSINSRLPPTNGKCLYGNARKKHFVAIFV